MSMNTTSAIHSASDSYTDLNGVRSIRSLKNKNQALTEVSKQFESMFVRMMLKSMRQANAVFSEDNFLSSEKTAFYQSMLDDQLALDLSKGRGLGLREVLERQLQQSYGDESKKVDASDSVAQLPRNTVSDKAIVNSVQDVQDVSPAKPLQAIQFDGSPEDFIEQLYDIARGAAKELDVEPEVLIAQAALETGWGKKVNVDRQGNSSFNLFNIKADQRWNGGSVQVSTLEFREGLPQKEQARFRAYESPQQSFGDYVEFIKSSGRYRKAVEASDSESYVRELAKAGYATDPQYADKILRVLNSDVMQKTLEKFSLTNSQDRG
jgi:flagellar protein FlgJ